MNRLDATFLTRRPLLACYLPVGDPLIPLHYTQIYMDCGVDILELGMPSADPYLDGEDVSASMGRALAAGKAISALGAFTAWARSGPRGPACISMCYSDFDVYSALSSSAYDGIDGLLMLGLDTRADSAAVKAKMRARGIRLIGLAPADLTPDGIAAARRGEGYVMLQAAGGVTGPRATLDPANRAKIARLRDAGVAEPILLGFGIGTAEQAAEAVAMGADGVVIGSMCVRKAVEGPEALGDFLQSVRRRLDG